jgi:hypothetical protein
MCIACEMDFWLVAEELLPEEPAAAFACDPVDDEPAESVKPASEPRD